MKKLFLLFAAIVTMAISAAAQQRTIHGTVYSSTDKEPLVGATVRPVGTGNPVITDIDGHFTLSVPASVKSVTVSYVGYETKTAPVSDDMKVFLDDSNQLEEVVVTGYGSARKLGSVVGSVSVVNSEAFETTPASTFIDALQGQVPGLAIYSNSGDPSSISNSIYMRGMNSLSASNAPLYILDGAPISAQLFTSLNPADIESISVLKDAASTAIYGARAANGVIVITSKKGKFGQKSQVTIRASYGWSQMAMDNVTMMNSAQYVQYRDLIGQPVTDLARKAAATFDTDWTKEMFKDNAPTYSLEAVVQGGTDALSYYMSVNHYDQAGLIEHSDMRRESIRFSLDSKVNDWFRIGMQSNLGYVRSETNGVNNAYYNGTASGFYTNDPIFFAHFALPYDSPMNYDMQRFQETGEVVYTTRAEKSYFTTGQGNLPWFYYWDYDSYQTRVTANLNTYEQITPIKGLTIRAQQALDAVDFRTISGSFPWNNYYNSMGLRVGSATDANGRWQEGLQNEGINGQSFQRNYQWTFTNTAEYRFSIDKVHNITALVGQESILSKLNFFSVSARGLTDARLLLLQNGDPERYSASQDISKSVFNSYFFNFNYDFDSRYFLEVSYRRDGSSRFAPGHRWGNFYSVGLMWNAKNEKFLKGITWLDELRLRANVGSTGNAGIGDYAWQGEVVPGGRYDGENGIVISSPDSRDLTWETVVSRGIGVDFGFLKRIRGKFDVYKNTTKDMLMGIPYSITTGVGSLAGNMCEMDNKGFELEINGDIYQSKDWYVGARIGIAYNKNEITKLFDGSDKYVLENRGLCYQVGHSAFEYYAVPYVGVDPRDGKQVWLDVNGNKTKVFDPNARRLVDKAYVAPWTGGFATNVRWRDLSLSTAWAFALEKYMNNNFRYFTNNNAMGVTGQNQSVEMLNVWTTPGQVTDIPAYGETLQMDGDNFIEDASFLRLKNVTLQYSLPKTLVERWGMKALSFHFTGRNLLTFCKDEFTGYDPEPQSNYVQLQYPNTRQYEFGFEVTF